jgi:hypothetical protein
MRQERIITIDPKMITGPRLHRSVILPEKMEKAYIPRVWAEITSDTAVRGCRQAIM